jgi:hypothetical protein
MRDRGRATANRIDAELAEEEAALIKRTSSNLAALKPRISDPAAFDRLLAAVRASTAANESVAQLQDRLKALGQGVVKVAKEASGLLA